MNFNHLHYFHVIATEGTLSRGAKKLGISQPTLSAQLKQLEDYFGRKLFDRASGSLRLNANGRKALEITHEMFRLGERLDELFPIGKPRPVIRLEIGISTVVARSFGVDRFVRLFGNHEILTRVRQGDHESLYHELLTSGLDLFITDSLPDKRHAGGIVHRQLGSPEFVIIAPAKGAGSLSAEFPASLHHQPFIHYTSHSSHRFEIDQYFRDHRIEPAIIAEADDMHLILASVAAGIGAGVVPRHVAGEAKNRKEIVVLGTIDRPFEIHGLYNRQDPTEDVLAALDLLADPAAE